jgi:hypothetical protein
MMEKSQRKRIRKGNMERSEEADKEVECGEVRSDKEGEKVEMSQQEDKEGGKVKRSQQEDKEGGKVKRSEEIRKKGRLIGHNKRIRKDGSERGQKG